MHPATLCPQLSRCSSGTSTLTRQAGHEAQGQHRAGHHCQSVIAHGHDGRYEEGLVTQLRDDDNGYGCHKRMDESQVRLGSWVFFIGMNWGCWGKSLLKLKNNKTSYLKEIFEIILLETETQYLVFHFSPRATGPDSHAGGRPVRQIHVQL